MELGTNDLEFLIEFILRKWYIDEEEEEVLMVIVAAWVSRIWLSAGKT